MATSTVTGTASTPRRHAALMETKLPITARIPVEGPAGLLDLDGILAVDGDADGIEAQRGNGEVVHLVARRDAPVPALLARVDRLLGYASPDRSRAAAS